MKSCTQKQYLAAIAKAKWPEPRYIHSKRSTTVLYSVDGIEIAEKTALLKRDKVVSESYMANPDYFEELTAEQEVKILSAIEAILSDSENTGILFENDKQYDQLVEVVDAAIRSANPIFIGDRLDDIAINDAKLAACTLSKTWIQS